VDIVCREGRNTQNWEEVLIEERTRGSSGLKKGVLARDVQHVEIENARVHAIENQRTHGRVLSWSREDLKPRLEKKRVAGLMLAGKKPTLEGEGVEG
jgi:hypothetical protein